MKRFLLLTTAIGFFATMAQAGITEQQVIDLYTSQGYTNIEVTTGPTQMKVEAVQGTAKVEVIYDIETGAILKQENSTASADDLSSDPIETKTSDKDFLRGGSDDNGSDDSSDDDSDDDSDDGAGHDVGDDHGGDDDSSDDGADHDVGDDHGGDDDGSDDDSGDDNSGSDDSDDDHSGSGSDDNSGRSSNSGHGGRHSGGDDSGSDD